MKFEFHLSLSRNSSVLSAKEPTPKQIAENLLIEYLQNQDKKAFALLYDSYSPALFGVILRIVKDYEMAEDVLQECFVRIWSTFTAYDANKGKLYTWLLNIARNLAIDKIRSRKHLEGLKTFSFDKSQLSYRADTNSFQPEHIGLKELTNQLGPHQKQIIDLMYFEGYTQTEIAQELGIPLGTVKTRARKAIQQLQALIR